jgi:hypothetical protein
MLPGPARDAFTFREAAMDPLTEKVCPTCAEVIKVAAKRCRFCGHEFSAQVVQAAQQQAAQQQARAKMQAAAAAARRLTARRVEELQNRRNGFVGCGAIMGVLGLLLLLMMVAMFVSQPKEGTTVAQQKFSALMCASTGALPLVALGFLCVRAGLRANAERQAYAANDEESARQVCLRGKKARWLEWGVVLACFGVALLVIRLGFFPSVDDKDESGRQAAGAICLVFGIAPVLLGGVLLLVGALSKPSDDGPPEVGLGADGGDSSPLAVLFNRLDEDGVRAFSAHLSGITSQEAANFGQRLKRATPEEIDEIADEFNDEGRRS